jgi:hypothetical protein
MRAIRKLIVGIAATMLSATAAYAADPIIIPPPAPPPPFVAPVVSPFAGLYFGGHYTQTISVGPFRAIGGQVGFNVVNGALLFGGEARVGYVLSPINSLYLQGNGRVGFVLGDMFLIYGTAGIGSVFNAGPFNYFNYGAGAEVAFGNIGIFGEITRVQGFGGGPTFSQFSIGVNFHP